MVGKKHVTSACMNCRRRKVKCDGNETCANCSTANLPCEYNAEADMRKVSGKKVIGELRARVAQLESTLRQNGLQEHVQASGFNCENPTTAHDARPGPQARDAGDSSVSPGARPYAPADSDAPATISPPLLPSNPPHTAVGATQHRYQASATPDADVSHSRSQSGPSPPGHSLFDLVAENRGGKTDEDPQIVSAQRGSFSSSSHDCSPNIGNDFVSISTREFFKTTAPALPLPPTPSNIEGAQDGAEADSIESMLSARMGSLRIAEDGQMRYYGPTSNLHVQTGGSHFLSQSRIRQVAIEGAGVLRRLGLDRAVPFDMELHLARLYFAWEDPNVHAVDEEIYFEEKQKWADGSRASNYYSETLNNAICAIGASLAVDEDLGFPDGRASEFFSARAKALLDVEMDSPTVATVQALVVMSASEAALTRDARGWLYSGMAARLSADLGLHMTVTKHLASGIMTERDVKIRATTFWGVFIHEVMWSLYVGRPSGLGVRTISVERPDSSLDAIKMRMWTPYPKTPQQCSLPETGLFFPAEAITDATITQCEFMAKINSTLYSGRTMLINELMTFLIQMRRSLYEWRDNLPEPLKVDLTDSSRVYIPAVLQLHMQFYALMITLYRPYLATSLLLEEKDIVSEEGRAALRNAPADCVEAARNTTEYLRCYQKQYTMMRSNIQVVHIIFTAALIFIYDICSKTHHQLWTSQRNLQFCSDLLGQLGRCYGNANRALEVTVLVKHQWWKASTARQARTSAIKRDSGNISRDGSWGDGTLNRGDAECDSSERGKRRYSPATGNAASQSIETSPSSSAFQTFDQYVEQGTFASGFGAVEGTTYGNNNNPFMDDTELYLNNMGEMEWFDPAQFSSAHFNQQAWH